MSPPAPSVLPPTLLFLFFQAQGQEKVQAPPFSQGLVQMSLERSLPRPPEVSASDISDPLVSCHRGSEGEDLG